MKTTKLAVFCKNALIEMRRRKCYFCLALFSVTIVVMTAAVTRTITNKAPLIFLTLAENEAGQIDIEVGPSFIADGSAHEIPEGFLLNQSRVDYLMQEAGLDMKFSTPRWTFSGYVYAAHFSDDSTCTEEVFENNLKDPVTLYNTNNYLECSWSEIDVFVIDTQKEKELEIGRDYLEDSVPEFSAYMSSAIKSTLRYSEGSLVLRLTSRTLLENLVEGFGQETGREIDFQQTPVWGNLMMAVNMSQVLSSTNGKVPNSESRVIFLEYEHLFKQLGRDLPQEINKTFGEEFHREMASWVYGLDPAIYAQKILVNLMPERLDYYIKSSYDEIQKGVVEQANALAEALGIHSLSMKLNVLKELSPLKFGAVFLGYPLHFLFSASYIFPSSLTMDIIVTVVFLLSVVLIFNLLLVSVDTRTFEFGMFRVLGLARRNLAQMVLFQALSFVVS